MRFPHIKNAIQLVDIVDMAWNTIEKIRCRFIEYNIIMWFALNC